MSDTPLQATREQPNASVTPSVPEVLSDAAKRSVLKVQDYARMSARSLTNLFTRPRYGEDTLDQMDDIGVGSLPIVLLSGFFIGAVMVLQTGSQFQRFGQVSLTGDIVSLALVRELGPSITG
ncbi:MAG: ABC transporter permease, partial [Candidatus Acidiferrum sp.]